MVHFPLLQHLKVEKYGLYPGPSGDGVFDLEFASGMTLVLGANGLGKTTLMTLVFRMLAGTYDIGLPEEIGSSNLQAYELNRAAKRQFADRVNDGAREARATLTFTLGGTEFTLVRQLADLSLQELRVDQIDRPADEKSYQAAIQDASGLGAYADWLLILRTLVFFFEDRRALVWDPDAQRQLLRCLFLSPAQAGDWTAQERAVLELDSRMRNLQAVVRREQKERAKVVKQIDGASDVQAALNAAESSLATLNRQHAELLTLVDEGEQARQIARLNALRAQNEHDHALRELERARLFAVESHLPQADDSMKFMFVRLMSDETCLACGTRGVHEKRASLELALAAHHCLVCNSNLSSAESVIDLGDRKISDLQAKVESTLVHALEQARLRDEVSERYQADGLALSVCATERADVVQHIRTLASQLPADERKVGKQQGRLAAAEELVKELRARLQTEREKFSQTIDAYRRNIERNAEAIRREFVRAAGGFLFEESGLSWSPSRRGVGQAGGMEPVEYPAFAVELSGSDFVGLQRRSSPDQVSESQREFIDLAFRMALMQVASPGNAATLAVDAPESSLDAVFVDKAAEVLATFANSDVGNRLIITSNLGAGELVPQLLRTSPDPARRMDPLIDLFEAGVPTRAMLESKAAYDHYWAELRKKVAA